MSDERLLSQVAACDLPRSSIREIVENCTLRRIGSRRTSGNIVSIAVELFVCHLDQQMVSKGSHGVSNLRLKCVEEGQARPAVDRVNELFLGYNQYCGGCKREPRSRLPVEDSPV